MLAASVEQTKIAFDDWTNLARKNNDIEILYQQRQRVCAGCEHLRAFTCGLCGCPLAAKLRATGG